MKRDTEQDRLMRNYAKAEGELRQHLRDKFPVGCRVLCRLSGLVYTVKDGSLYADHLSTDKGHISTTFIEKIEEAEQ